MSKSILIIGAGNTIMADEGVGPRCVEALQEWFEFDDTVELTDAGTMGLGLLDTLRNHTDLIVLDAAKDTGHPPGTVIVYTPEDLAQHQVLHSAHDMRFVDVLKSAKLMGIELETVYIVAVQVKDMSDWVLDLTPEIADAVPIACACALQQLEALGAHYTQRSEAQVPAEFFDALENFSA